VEETGFGKLVEWLMVVIIANPTVRLDYGTNRVNILHQVHLPFCFHTPFLFIFFYSNGFETQRCAGEQIFA